MTEKQAYRWNWGIAIFIALLVVWSIFIDSKFKDKSENKPVNTVLIIIKNMKTNDEIRFRYPQDSAKAKTDSTVYKLFNAVGKSIGDAVKK